MRLLLLLSVSLIFALGLMMVYDTTSAAILDRALSIDLHRALVRQLVYAGVGLVIAFCAWRVGYEALLKFSLPLLFVVIFFLVLVFVPGVGQVRNGARRWLAFGTFTFQPSEFAKLLLPLVYVDWFLSRGKEMVTFSPFFRFGLFLAVPIALVLLEPDNGSAAVMGASLLPLFYVTGIRFKYWALPVLVLLILGGAVAYQLPYVRGRIQVYLHPELDIRGKGHQPHQAKIAAGSGKLFGRGPGGSLQKLTYLPEAQNDYIAAIFAEEFGFFGILALITLYMLFAFAGFSIAMRSSDQAGSYAALGLTFLVVLQAFLNLAVVSGLLPSKGVNLPFFSQGGSSMITNLLATTLLLNIARVDGKKTAHS